MNKIYNIVIVMIILLSSTINAFGQDKYEEEKAEQDSLRQLQINALYLIEDRPHEIYGIIHIKNKVWDKLPIPPQHPGFDQLITPEVKDSLLKEINSRFLSLQSDTLTNKDFFYVWKPYYDWAYNIDPHYRIVTGIDAPTRKITKKIWKYIEEEQKRIPVIICNIRDTIIVYKSFDPAFKPGDVFQSINGIRMSEYLKYCYKDRFSAPYEIIGMYHFKNIDYVFDIELLRDGKKMSIQTEGIHPKKIFKSAKKQDSYNIRTYQNEKCGYIQIKEFLPNNNHLIRTLYSKINKFKADGINNVIIDVRRNPGGSGHNFDKLLSIFTDKPKISYMKKQTLRISKFTLDYEFASEDMIGKNVEFPADEFYKDIELDPEMYVSGMNYYVLASELTGSTSASFVNILQYSNIATIVGEPLLKNALKYGEIIPGIWHFERTLLCPAAISTVEYDEYTKAVDGVLMPDIHIPYVAKEYMTGKDAVLEKLLAIIKNKQ